MIAAGNIPLPSGGINISDSPTSLDDTQCQALDNLLVTTGSLSSIRPNESFTGRVVRDPTYPYTDDIYVYRKTNGTIQYMMAYMGKVYYSTTKYTPLNDIGYPGTPGHRISFIQFQDQLFIYDGLNIPYVWNGSNLRRMGIIAPDTAPTVDTPSPVGTDVRTYYYTYYNSIDNIESNPSPAGGILTATSGIEGGTVNVTVTASTDTQVDKIRIYRTGYGVVTPKFVIEISNVSSTITDNSVETAVVVDTDLEFDRDVPVAHSRAMITNNRVWCWGAPGEDGDILWVSNEFEGEYYPIIPFYDQTESQIKSGGPLTINPGDGSEIVAAVPWGSNVIAMKRTAVYRVQETEVGFYGYQSMGIPGCIAGKSAVLTPYGLIYLADSGFVLIDGEESVTRIGDSVVNLTCNITDYDTVVATTFRGVYIVSFQIGSVWHSLMYINGSGWQGYNNDYTASAYFNDADILLAGSIDHEFAYIEECQLNKVGSVLTKNVHKPIVFRYRDKLREFYPSYYSRIRDIRIYGDTVGGKHDQNLTVNVYDENETLLDTNEFVMPSSGSIAVGIDSKCMSRYLLIEITGTITRPIRISGVRPTVEQIGYGWGE